MILPGMVLARHAACARGARRLQLPFRAQGAGQREYPGGALGEEFGFGVKIYPEQLLRGHHVSSSEIRKLIAEGKVGQSARAAGPAVQHHFESRPRPRLRHTIHRADGQPGAL